MEPYDFLGSRKQDDEAECPIKIDDPAWATVFASRKKDDRAENAFLYVFQCLEDAIPHIDDMYRLEVFGPLIADGTANRLFGSAPDSRRAVDHTSSGFKMGLLKKRAFLAVFLVGTFKARFPHDTERFAFLLQAASGAVSQGVVDQPGTGSLAKSDVAPEITRYMMSVFEQGAAVLSDLSGFLAACNDDPRAFGRGMKPLYDLYHEVYLQCFGQTRYSAEGDGQQSLRAEFHKYVIESVQFCFEAMTKVAKGIDELA